MLEYDARIMEDAVFRTAFLARLEETGLKPAQVADRAGVPRDRVYNITKREKASTAVETGVAIAHSFGLTVEEFMDWETFGAKLDHPLQAERLAILSAAIEEAVTVARRTGRELSPKALAKLVMIVASQIKKSPDADPATREEFVLGYADLLLESDDNREAVIESRDALTGKSRKKSKPPEPSRTQ